MSNETHSAGASSDFDDQRIEIIIGTLLRTGVLLAASVVLIGATVYLARHGHEMTHYRSFHGEPESLKSVSQIAQGAFTFKGSAIIQLGLLLLVATPVARVLFSAIAFAIERDYMYVIITLIVFGVLTYSLFGTS